MNVTQSSILNFRVIQQKAGEWLLKQLNQIKDSDATIQLKKDNILNVDGEDEINIFALTCTNDHYELFPTKSDDESLAAFVSRNQREKVRQFIEELLAKMVDGPLDDVSVGQLSTDENCKYIMSMVSIAD